MDKPKKGKKATSGIASKVASNPKPNQTAIKNGKVITLQQSSINEAFKNGGEKRAARKFGRAVNKATKVINRGGVNFEEDYGSNVANMDPAMRTAFLKSSQGQDYVNAKMSDTTNKNEETARELMGMKKGGISTKGNSFFNPGLSKRKK